MFSPFRLWRKISISLKLVLKNLHVLYFVFSMSSRMKWCMQWMILWFKYLIDVTKELINEILFLFQALYFCLPHNGAMNWKSKWYNYYYYYYYYYWLPHILVMMAIMCTWHMPPPVHFAIYYLIEYRGG